MSDAAQDAAEAHARRLLGYARAAQSRLIEKIGLSDVEQVELVSTLSGAVIFLIEVWAKREKAKGATTETLATASSAVFVAILADMFSKSKGSPDDALDHFVNRVKLSIYLARTIQGPHK